MSASETVTPRLYAETLPADRAEERAASTRLFPGILTAIGAAIDFATCAAGIFAACFLQRLFQTAAQSPYPIREAAAVGLCVSSFAVLLLQRNGAYAGSGGLLQIRHTERAIRIPVQSALVMLPFSLLLPAKLSAIALLIALVLIPVLLMLQKHLFVAIVHALQVRGHGADRAIVYGVGETGKRILSALSHSIRPGIHPVAVIDDNSPFGREWISELGYRRRRSVPVHRGPITSALLQSCRCGTLIVALPNLSARQVAAALNAAQQAGARVLFLSAMELQEQKWTQSIDIDGLSLTPMLEPAERRYYAIAKRMVDLIGSSLLLVLLAPLFFLIALVIMLDSPGPAIFVQDRVGRDGKLFKMYKFRSMHVGAPSYELSPTTPRDSRTTRIGRFLRRSSLDELPQLINVLLGNMSLVGPRPEMPFIVRNYTPAQRQRLQVLPGITGLWQLSADRAFLIHENVDYDLYYIRNRGFFMDIAILVHTLFFAMSGGV